MSLRVIEAQKIDYNIIKTFEMIPENAGEIIIKFKKQIPKRNNNWKKDLLSVSIWSNNDVKQIENMGEEINKWIIEKY